MKNLPRILESLLFVSEEPLTVAAVKRILDMADGAPIREAFKELVDRYRQQDGGFYLAEVANGYQFRTAPESMQWVRRMLQPAAPRLSKAALETLAIIAYKQPVIRADIEHIRGVDCGGVVRMLLERKLVRILGRKEIPGRPLLYATTKQFLQVFDLKDLKELPSPKEIEEMAAEQMGTAQGADAEGDATGEPAPDLLENELDNVPADGESGEMMDPEAAPDEEEYPDSDAGGESDESMEPNPDEDPSTVDAASDPEPDAVAEEGYTDSEAGDVDGEASMTAPETEPESMAEAPPAAEPIEEDPADSPQDMVPTEDTKGMSETP